MTEKIRKRVFLSYAREDAASARQLRADLESLGVDVWFDERSLLPGQNWRREIRNAIRSSDFFILILSRYSVTKRGVVQRELRDALDVMHEMPEGAVFIVPAWVERVEPNHELLRDIQWVDLFDDWTEGVRRIGLTLFRKDEPAPQESELVDLMQAAKSIIATVTANDVNARIRFMGTPDTAVIAANPSVVNVVVRELLANAIRHASPDLNGERSVGLEVRSTPETVTLEIRNRMVANIELNDRLFQRTVGGPGAAPGYGLWLARNAAIQYGGKLEISTQSTSEEDPSAEFVASLSFPRQSQPVKGDPSQRSKNHHSGRPGSSSASAGSAVQGSFKGSEERRLPRQPPAYRQGAASLQQNLSSISGARKWLGHLNVKRFTGIVVSAVALLILSVIFGTRWMDNKQESQRSAFEDEAVRLNQPAGSVRLNQPPEIDFTLYPGLVRGDGEKSTVVSLAGAQNLRLHLLLLADKYQSYQSKLLTEDGRTLMALNDLRASIQDSQKAVIMKLPAQGLTSGDYRIDLSGRNANGSTQEVAAYYFRLVNK